MESALSALNDLNINGKKLRVEEAKGRPPRDREGGPDDGNMKSDEIDANVD